MKIYAVSDNEKLVFYSDDIHGKNIPASAVEITHDQWQDALSHTGKYIVQGDRLVAVAVWPPPLTADQKKSLANADVYGQIAILEKQQTPRMLRETALGSETTNPDWKNNDGTLCTAVQQLSWIDAQISTLKAQIQK